MCCQSQFGRLLGLGFHSRYLCGFVFLFAVWSLIASAPVQAGGKKRLLTKEKVVQALQQYILKRGPWRREQIEVRVRAFRPLPVPEGRVKLRVIKPRNKVRPGSRSFLLAVDVEGKEKARVWVHAEISVFDTVLVSVRPIARHLIIAPEDVRLERREISSLTTRAFTEIGEVVGKQASRAIGVNEILTARLIRLPKVVHRGGAVTLLYETSVLQIEASGRALEGGRVGDVIRVKNPSSGKVIEGKILNARTVRVNW